MKTYLYRLLLFISFLLITGCSDSDPSGANSQSNVTGNQVVFNPSTGEIPLPNILATATAADPLAGRPANKPMNPAEALAYVNKYEVGSTGAVAGVNAPIYIRFATPVDPATVTAANIKVFQISADSSSTSATENSPLGFTDISALFDYTYTAGSTDLHLFPKFPLSPGTRYLYLVSNRVHDAATGRSVVSSSYFDILKSIFPLVGPFAALEPIRANVMSGTNIKLSGYAKVMDDLISAGKVANRDEIALMGRFITTGAGFVSKDAIGTMIPVERALRAFAAGAGMGGLPGITWTNSINTTTTVTPSAYWAEIGTTLPVPASVGSVIKGSINSAQLSIDPVVARANTATMNLTGVTLAGLPAYNPAAGVTQPFRDAETGALTGYYHTQVSVPFVYIVPTGTAPAGGWPLAIYQHGINQQKEEVVAVAGSLTGAGFAVVAIDLPLHGELAVNGHSQAYWGADIMALGAPLASRSNIQQAAFNLNRLEITVLGGGFAVLGADAPNRTTVKPKFIGHSMGAFMGAYYLAGNTTLATSGYPYTQATLNSDMKGFLSVPAGRLMYLLQNSPTYGPPAIAGLASVGIATNSPTYHNFWQVSQSVIDPADPATMTSPLASGLPSRLSGRIAVQEAVGDQSVPNANTRYFGNALGGRGILGGAGAVVAPGFMQLGYVGGSSPIIPSTFMYNLVSSAPAAKVDFAAASAAAVTPVEGYFQFDQPGIVHRFLIDGSGSEQAAANTALAQRQLAYFMTNGIVVDPSGSALPKAAVKLIPGLAGEILLPPVQQVFGY